MASFYLFLCRLASNTAGSESASGPPFSSIFFFFFFLLSLLWSLFMDEIPLSAPCAAAITQYRERGRTFSLHSAG